MAISRITSQDINDHINRGEQVQFVDSRNPQAWGAARTKLPGAVRVPADEAEKYVSNVGRDRLIVTYCT